MMIPYGYKQTEVGVIPEDWSVSALEKLYNITSSKRVFQSQWRKSGVPFYRAREIAVMSEGKIAPEDLYIDESLYNQYIHQYGSINKNDILITGVGTLGKVYVVKENDRFYFKDGNIIWLQAKHDFSSIYLKYQYDMPALINQVLEMLAVAPLQHIQSQMRKLQKYLYPLFQSSNALPKHFRMWTA